MLCEAPPSSTLLLELAEFPCNLLFQGPSPSLSFTFTWCLQVKELSCISVGWYHAGTSTADQAGELVSLNGCIDYMAAMDNWLDINPAQKQ